MMLLTICKEINPIVNAIQQLPFNLELTQGTLPKEKFDWYLMQDAIYLNDYTKALAITAAKLPHHQHMQQFLQFAVDAIKAERELHAHHINPECFATIETMPACFMYTNYLLKTALMSSVEEAVASLLPCFWVYREVGKQMQMYSALNNPYQSWIDLYAGESFNSSVQAAMQTMEELYITASDSLKNKMVAAFTRSTQLEWLFWDHAYRQESWWLSV